MTEASSFFHQVGKGWGTHAHRQAFARGDIDTDRLAGDDRHKALERDVDGFRHIAKRLIRSGVGGGAGHVRQVVRIADGRVENLPAAPTQQRRTIQMQPLPRPGKLSKSFARSIARYSTQSIIRQNSRNGKQQNVGLDLILASCYEGVPG